MSPLSGMPDQGIRRSVADIDFLRQTIVQIIGSHDQLTIRYLFYPMVTRGVIEKTGVVYNNVVASLALQLRRSESEREELRIFARRAA